MEGAPNMRRTSIYPPLAISQHCKAEAGFMFLLLYVHFHIIYRCD